MIKQNYATFFLKSKTLAKQITNAKFVNKYQVF